LKEEGFFARQLSAGFTVINVILIGNVSQARAGQKMLYAFGTFSMTEIIVQVVPFASHDFHKFENLLE
jgi:hypothetical protein